MLTIQLRITAPDIDKLQKVLDPQQVYTALNLWYQRGAEIVARELRQRAPNSLKSQVYYHFDVMRPPRWARIGVRGRPNRHVHLLELGTGRFAGHVPYFPNVTKLIVAMGLLDKQTGFLVARSIFRRGGTPAKPFIQPAWQATNGRIEGLAETVVQEVLNRSNPG